MKVKEFFADESKWCNQKISSNGRGPNGELCLYLAIDFCYSHFGPIVLGIRELVRQEIKQPRGSIALWNDEPQRTFQDIKNLVEKLNV